MEPSWISMVFLPWLFFTIYFILSFWGVQKWIHISSPVMIRLKNSFPLAKYRVRNCNIHAICALRLSSTSCWGTHRAHTFLMCRWSVSPVQIVQWPASCRKRTAIWDCLLVTVYQQSSLRSMWTHHTVRVAQPTCLVLVVNTLVLFHKPLLRLFNSWKRNNIILAIYCT